MKLALSEINPSGYVRLAAEGEITIRDFADPGKNPFELTLGANWAAQRVLVNLGQVGFIDSSAIGWLIDSHRRFHSKGGRMVLYSPTPRVKDVIDLLKMRQVLDIRETESDAVAALTAKETVPTAAADQQGHP